MEIFTKFSDVWGGNGVLVLIFVVVFLTADLKSLAHLLKAFDRSQIHFWI